MRKQGYTLIELIVVIAVLSIVLGAVFGIFTYAIRAHRHSLSTQYLLDQASYLIEYMSRYLRMAKKDMLGPGGTCLLTAGFNYELTWSGHGIKFKNYYYNENLVPPDFDCMEFYLENEKIKQKINNGAALPLTSDKIDVKNFRFYVTGADQTDDLQPKVTMILELEANDVQTHPKIKIQTTVSQRDSDIEETLP